MKAFQALAFTGLSAIAAMLASCGPEPPQTSGKEKPKPVYEVPESQLKADLGKEAAAAATAAQPKKAQATAAQSKGSAPASLSGKSNLKDGGSVSGGASVSKPSLADPGPSSAAKTAQASAANKPETESKAGAATGTAPAGAISSVMNYATGTTQLTAKKRATEKLKAIQDTHNSNLEKAMQEDK